MEQEKKNVYACPVCGRFTKKAAVDRYHKMLSDLADDIDANKRTIEGLQKQNAELHDYSEKETTIREAAEAELTIVKNNLERSVQENTRLQTKISNHDAEVAKLHKTIDDQAKHITYLTHEVEAWKAKAQQLEETVEKLHSVTWWQRLLGILP